MEGIKRCVLQAPVFGEARHAGLPLAPDSSLALNTRYLARCLRLKPFEFLKLLRGCRNARISNYVVCACMRHYVVKALRRLSRVDRLAANGTRVTEVALSQSRQCGQFFASFLGCYLPPALLCSCCLRGKQS